MNFTFEEWCLIRQAVTQWAERSEEILKDCKPSDEKLSMYQIYFSQSKKLRDLETKINQSVI